jgi:hypothetical protein
MRGEGEGVMYENECCSLLMRGEKLGLKYRSEI